MRLVGIFGLADPDDDIRQRAIFALGLTGKPRDGTLLLPLTKAKNEFVRGVAIDSLGDLYDCQAPSLLKGKAASRAIQMLRDRSPFVRFSAVVALSKLEPAGWKESISKCRNDHAVVFRMQDGTVETVGSRVSDALETPIREPD